jgi:hypothetical protein
MNWLKCKDLSVKEKPYFDNLDVLRFVAAFSVLVFHLGRDLQDWFAQYKVHSWFQYVTKITDKGALCRSVDLIVYRVCLCDVMSFDFN